jgi:RimJ/RimL family protein N-acetyltransferase
MPQRGLRPWTDARTREAFAAISAADQFLGSGLAPEIDHDAVEAELDYIVAPAAGGRGAATEILRPMGVRATSN